jgi:hypothetical protein
MNEHSPRPASRIAIELGLVFLLAWLFFWVFIRYYVEPNFVGSRTSRSFQCITNLRQIEAAKNEWAMVNGQTNGAAVTENDLTPYIQLTSNLHIPKCPSGGIYTFGTIGELPTCSLGTNVSPPHVL